MDSRLINRRLASADFHAPAKNLYRFQFHNPDTQETEMFSHVMVGSNDIERSMRFYNAVLGVLGAGEPIRN